MERIGGGDFTTRCPGGVVGHGKRADDSVADFRLPGDFELEGGADCFSQSPFDVHAAAVIHPGKEKTLQFGLGNLPGKSEDKLRCEDHGVDHAHDVRSAAIRIEVRIEREVARINRTADLGFEHAAAKLVLEFFRIDRIAASIDVTDGAAIENVFALIDFDRTGDAMDAVQDGVDSFGNEGFKGFVFDLRKSGVECSGHRFLTDKNGTKHSFNEQQLKALAAQGKILPTTPLETDTGYKGVAGQIPDLTFNTVAPPVNQTMPQSTPAPVVERSTGSSWQVTLIGIVLIAVVGGIGWAIINGTAPSTEQTKTNKLGENDVATMQANKEQAPQNSESAPVGLTATTRQANNEHVPQNVGLPSAPPPSPSESKTERVKRLRTAADRGDAQAQCDLGKCYADGDGVDGDKAEAVQWFRKAAEQGHAEAQWNLGFCCANGTGIAEDKAEAVQWFRKAAEQGFARAKHSLGTCYVKGWGVTASKVEAAKWYRQAAEGGYAGSQNALGVCYRDGEDITKNPVEAVKWFHKAAEQGNAEAQCNLGICYSNGEGTTENKDEAAQWFIKAAEQGDAGGQFQLGSCYFYGKGVVKDEEEAVQWFIKAAEQGYADSQYFLGLCYCNGKCVTKNLVEAVKWFRKAAEQGNADAQYSLGICLCDGTGVAPNPAEAAKWFQKATEQGNGLAMFRLGWCYTIGAGVPRNLAAAAVWYRRAAENGINNANRSLAVLDLLRKSEVNMAFVKSAQLGSGMAMVNLEIADILQKEEQQYLQWESQQKEKPSSK